LQVALWQINVTTNHFIFREPYKNEQFEGLKRRLLFGSAMEKETNHRFVYGLGTAVACGSVFSFPARINL
jgi:hypothetical protein